VWQFLQNTIRSLEGAPRASEQEARNLAGAFLFTGNEQEKPIGDLSGGERGRLVLASLIASAKNLLILDEPTNHLDIPSAERLEESLLQFGGKADGKGGFGGVLLLISHDRALLQDVCDTIVILDGEGNTRVFEGSYREWEARQKVERSEAVQRAKKPDGKSGKCLRSKARVSSRVISRSRTRCRCHQRDRTLVELRRRRKADSRAFRLRRSKRASRTSVVNFAASIHRLPILASPVTPRKRKISSRGARRFRKNRQSSKTSGFAKAVDERMFSARG
jgi:ATP-binding cassette subfamily F protein 3